MTQPPPCVGMPAKRPGARAGNVEQDRVEGRRCRARGVHRDESHVSGAEPVEVLRHPAESGRRAVRREDKARVTGKLERLAAGRGAEIADDRSRRQRRITSHQRGRRVLDETMTLPPGRELEEGGPLWQLDAVRY